MSRKDCLLLLRRHILFSAMNVGFTSFFIVNCCDFMRFKASQGNEEIFTQKNQRVEPTWSDLGNLTPLMKSNLDHDSFQEHDFSFLKLSYQKLVYC